jgi:diaminohydroxyphosphoribosylaminopyrimidine deaminase/5-amino-6-(5-phosphoribosylamino)uracil reductase
VDDPLLTPREVFRERPLTRVVLDRRLRTPPDARLFSTLAAGPVIILTSPEARAREVDRVRALERTGATVLAVDAPGVGAALRALTAYEIQSVILEGGPTVQQAAWDEDVVDYVHVYVAPTMLGPEGVALLDGRSLAPATLVEPRVVPLGPDVLIEGYVHRPR